MEKAIFTLPVWVTIFGGQLLDRSTLINMDIFLALSWIGYFYFLENRGLKLLFLIIGVWTKSLLGFYPLLLESILFYKQKHKTSFALKQITVVFIASLWYLFSYLKYGQTFISEHFIDHLVKRITTPIELHFGGRLFYAQVFLENFKWLSLIIIFSLCLIGLNLLWSLKKKGLRKFVAEFDSPYLILLSALPFFVFLTFTKAKLHWYLSSLIPLFALTTPYLFFKLSKWKLLRNLFFMGTLFYCVSLFTQETYLLKLNYTIPNKTQIGLCLAKKQKNNLPVLYYVSEEERKLQNVLEAAHLDIGSSYIYGGAPAFVYYANHPVVFYYKLAPFSQALKRQKHPIVVIHRLDYKEQANLFTDFREFCDNEDWIALINK